MADSASQDGMCPKHPVHKLDPQGRCPRCMLEGVLSEGNAVDESDEEEELSEEEQMEKAVDLYEGLLCAVGGSKSEKLDSFDASTILAMLDDHRYRAKVRKAHQKVYG